MKRFALSVVFCVVSASAAFAQTKSPIEGVWKVTEVVLPGTSPSDKGTTISNPQPGLFIFTKGYYSQLFVRGDKPRAEVEPPKDPQNPTDAEKIALFQQWGPFIANSGTYEMKGATISMKPIVAKSANLMTSGASIVREFKLEGTNTLWLLPAGDQAANQPRMKLTRVE
ncbi:MAG TPA: hypothetical protein VKM94_08650 [Blastocatellia bacterium]|nr:hypothetical protein [Blastocatellia bacterium]